MSKVINIFTKQSVEADSMGFMLDDKSLDEATNALEIGAHLLLSMASENAKQDKEAPYPITYFQFDLLASHIIMQMGITRHYVAVLEQEINHLRLQVEGGAA